MAHLQRTRRQALPFVHFNADVLTNFAVYSCPAVFIGRINLFQFVLQQ
jgi:hypothetical protein